MTKLYKTSNGTLKIGLLFLTIFSVKSDYAQTSGEASRVFSMTELAPGISDMAPESPLLFNDKIIFSGEHGVFGRELLELKQNGDLSVVSDINPGINAAAPSDFCVYNNYLYFTAENEPGNREIFIYDGYGTTMSLEAIFNVDQGDMPRNLTVFNGEMYYQATTDELGTHIRKYNGGGASQVYYGPNNGLDVFLESAVVYNDELYSIFVDADENASLYKMDGTNAPEYITALGVHNAEMENQNFAEFNNEFYFLNNINSTNELWKYDGTNAAAPVVEVSNSEITNVLSIHVFNDKMILAAEDTAHGTELWSLDGTSQITLVADIEAGNSGSDVNHFHEYENTLYFTASTVEHGKELWSIDSNLNTLLVDDLNTGNDSSNPTEIFEAWDNMYIVATDENSGHEMWSFCTSSSTDVIETCAAFTWIDGVTYTESNNTAVYTMTNQAGCDSVVTLNLSMVDGNNTHMVYKIDDDGTGSLRYVIDNACHNDTIRFSSITDNRPIVLSNGELMVTKQLTIIGNGQENTIIDGDLATRVFNAEAPLWLSDLTITNGFDSYVGAGILTTSDLLLTSVSIENCEVYVPENEMSEFLIPPGGAAIAAMGNLCEIYGSNIAGNRTTLATPGPAIGPLFHTGSEGGLLSIVNSTITGNNIQATSPITSSIFAVNAYLVNATISGNRIEEVEDQDLNQTSGMLVWGSLKLHNSVVWDNVLEGIYEIEPGMTQFTNTLVKGLDTQDFEGTEAPGFVNPIPVASAPTTNGDYSLQCLSPLVEAGNTDGPSQFYYGNELVYAIDLDLYQKDGSGANRLSDYDLDEIAQVDIGAFENHLGNVSSIDSQYACSDLTWIDGQNYKSNNTTATHILIDEMGCKETVTLNLEISDLLAEAEIQGNFIAALDITAETIQWLDCDNDNEPIEGETGQTFIPESNGNYAALVTKGECGKITNCVGFIQTGIEDYTMDLVTVYPNPTQGSVQIDLAGLKDVTVQIYNANGKLIHEENQISQAIYNYNLDVATGFYLVQITSENFSKHVKLIKY